MALLAYPAFMLVVAASITGWGGLFPIRDLDWPRRFGLGVISVFIITAAAGWSGVLHPWLLWSVAACGLILLVRSGAPAIPAGIGLISLSGIVLLPLVMMPPASRDAMIHHLYQARLWLSAGRIVRPDWSVFFSYPYLTETLYTLAGGTFGFRISRVVSLLGFLTACSVPVTWFLKRKMRREAILTILVLMSIPELVRNATWSYSDSFLVMFSFLAYIEMQKENGSPVMALMWGAAAGCCKYNGLLVLISVAVLFPLAVRKISRRELLLSSLAVVLLSATWAVPNLIRWGNPVYPLFRGLIGPEAPICQRAADYFAAQSFSTSLHGPFDYLLLPIRMSIHGEWDNPVLFDGASGPLLLAGVIISLPVLNGRRRKLLLPVAYMLLALVFRGEGIRTRYLLPGLAMLSLPVSEGLSNLMRVRSRVISYAVLVLLAGCLAWSGLRIASLYSEEKPWQFPTDQEYLEEKLPEYRFFTECDPYISSLDTTLMVNIVRVFYYPGYAVFDQETVPLGLVSMFWNGMSACEVRDSLAADGITHVAMDMFLTSINVPTELNGDELVQWREFVSLELVPLMSVDDHVLFRLGR